MEYYSAMKRKEVSAFVTIWMACEGMMPSKVSQRGKGMCSLPGVGSSWTRGQVGGCRSQGWGEQMKSAGRGVTENQVAVRNMTPSSKTIPLNRHHMPQRNCERRVSRCGRLHHLSYFKKLPQPL